MNSNNISWTDTLWSELIWSCRHESVQHLDDLLLRRTRIGVLLPNGGTNEMTEIRKICQQELGWDDTVWSREWERYQQVIARHYSLPGRGVSSASYDNAEGAA